MLPDRLSQQPLDPCQGASRTPFSRAPGAGSASEGPGRGDPGVKLAGVDVGDRRAIVSRITVNLAAQEPGLGERTLSTSTRVFPEKARHEVELDHGWRGQEG